MTVILLADDSPHALRMGDAILSEEGYRVVSVKDAAGAAGSVAELDPELVIASASLPGGGIGLCRRIKLSHPHVKVILAAGTIEPLDELETTLAGCDAILRKPFEASALLDTVRPLLEAARKERAARGSGKGAPPINSDEVRVAVALAVEAELPRFLEEVTERVLRGLAGDASKPGLVA